MADSGNETVAVPTELIHRAAAALANTKDQGAREDLLALLPGPRFVIVDLHELDETRTMFGGDAYTRLDLLRTQPDALVLIADTLKDWGAESARLGATAQKSILTWIKDAMEMS